MFKLLRSYGIPDRHINTTNVSYANTKMKVYSPDGVSEDFDIVAGILQGDTL